jgi:ADP-heptose:LPS heptosyltransferase
MTRLAQRLPEVRFLSLQLGTPIPGIEDASTPDIWRLAQRIQALDLVITVDTALAHLAGALGVPTWTLLASPADWRWMVDRTDSPWYPTMRLFRQPAPGAWEPVLAEVCDALRSMAG